MKKSINRNFIMIIIFCLIVMFYSGMFSEFVYAAEERFEIKGKCYENKYDFSMTQKDIVSSMSYGKNIGSLFISCVSGHEAKYKGTQAYGVNGNVVIGYLNNSNNYQSSVKGTWNLEKSDKKKIGNIKLSKNVAKGTMIIQKSDDGKNWVDAIKPMNNLFSNKKINLNSIYNVPSEDVKSGKYYKILILYELKRKTGTKSGLLGFKSNVYEKKYCVEECVIYLCYGKNPVSILSLEERNMIILQRLPVAFR